MKSSKRNRFSGTSQSASRPSPSLPSAIGARKEFSQNFLKDRGILDAMESVVANSVATRGDQPPPFALEVGPGMGALTERLLKHLPVHAIEKDPRAVEYLKTHFDLGPTQAKATATDAGTERAPSFPYELQITAGDILEFEPDLLAKSWASLAEQSRAHPPLLVGNLPYAISSEFLLWCCRSPQSFAAGHFLLQKEVVERVTAAVGTKAYGRLGARLSLHFRTTVHFDVPPECFEPRPNVMSTFFSIEPLGTDADLYGAGGDLMLTFERCTAELYSRRRKMLRKTLEHLFSIFQIPYDEHKDTVAELLESFGITPEDRPERLSPQALLALARLVHTSSSQKLHPDAVFKEKT